MKNLTEKAMLVNVHISQWTARKYDKSVSKKVEEDYHAKDAGRYNKILVAVEEIQKIQKAVNTSRIFHYTNTLPWDNFTGDRLLPATNYMKYMEKMRELKNNMEEIVDRFIKVYPDLIEDAKIRLNGMFNSEDYPDPAYIKEKFSFDISIKPIPLSNDFRVSLNNEEIEHIKTNLEIRIKENLDKGMKDLWNRLYNTVKHMVDKLSEQDSIFRNSLVDNIVDLCSLLPNLNVTNDSNLEKLRQEVESRLCIFSPNDLRNNEDDRRQVVEDASKILEAMKGYIG